MNRPAHKLALLSTTAWMTNLIQSAQAHPGHDFLESSPSHLLTSPDHLLVLAVIGVVLFLVGGIIERRLPRHILRGIGAATVVVSGVVFLVGG